MLKKRPKHLALHLIKLPLPGFISILHRVSGLALFLALPLLLLMLQYSLTSIVTYDQLQDALAHPVARLLLLGLLWAFFHHFCAGIRYLALDLHYISSLKQARDSSKVVLLVSLALTVLTGAQQW